MRTKLEKNNSEKVVKFDDVRGTVKKIDKSFSDKNLREKMVELNLIRIKGFGLKETARRYLDLEVVEEKRNLERGGSFVVRIVVRR